MDGMRFRNKKVDRKSGYYDRDLETMPRAKKANYQNKLLADFIAYSYMHSKAVKNRFDDCGAKPEKIKSVADLKQIPPFSRRKMYELQEINPPFGGLLTTSLQRLGKIFVSPGPIYEPEGRSADYWLGLKAFYTIGFRRGDLVQNCFSYHLVSAGSMMEKSLLALGCTIVPMGPGNRELQLRVMRDLPVTGYTGNPSFLMEILRMAEDLNLKIPGDINLQIAYVSGEVFKDTIRHEAEQRYGIMIRQAYGTAETGLIAYECGYGNGMHVDERVILEIVNPETGESLPQGETGEVVVTLMRKQYPLIRMNLGDIGICSEEPCPCGRISPRLMRILGRADQSSRVKGIFLHPWEVDEMVKKFPKLGHYQFIITREENLDKLTFRAEWESETEERRENTRKMLEEAIKEKLRLKANVEFVSGDSFPKNYKTIDDQRG